MGREKGTLNISANFEPQIAAPFDSRIVVDTYADLTAEDTFISTDGNNYAYAGMLVSVVADADSNNNGVYLLKALPTTSIENWAGVGKGITGATPEYDDLAEYKVGDIIVYVSPYAEILEDGDPLKEEGLYECIADTEAGENPESAPHKWRYLGKLGETAGGTTITEIPGLQIELEDRVKYSDIGDNLIVTPNKQVNLDVTYLTVTGYSPAEDIQPDPTDEVKIGNIIFKKFPIVWTDGGPGIYPPNGDINNVPEYGWLYTPEAAERLVAAHPGYRLVTVDDFWSLIRAGHIAERNSKGFYNYVSPELASLDFPLPGIHNKIFNRYSFFNSDYARFWRKTPWGYHYVQLYLNSPRQQDLYNGSLWSVGPLSIDTQYNHISNASDFAFSVILVKDI